MSLPKAYLTEIEVNRLKKDLWEGTATQKELADKYNISQPLVSMILRGHQWPDTSWPDDSKGAMPAERYRIVIGSKRRANKMKGLKHNAIPSQEATRAADAVNKLMREDDIKTSNELTDIVLGIKTKEQKIKTLDYEEIRDRDPGNILVAQAEEGNGDDYLIAAMEIVFRDIPIEEWQASTTIEIVGKMKEKLVLNDKKSA